MPNLKDTGNDEAARKQLGKIMGQVLKTANEAVIEGYRVVRNSEWTRSPADNPMEVKHYTFSRLNHASNGPA